MLQRLTLNDFFCFLYNGDDFAKVLTVPCNKPFLLCGDPQVGKSYFCNWIRKNHNSTSLVYNPKWKQFSWANKQLAFVDESVPCYTEYLLCNKVVKSILNREPIKSIKPPEVIQPNCNIVIPVNQIPSTGDFMLSSFYSINELKRRAQALEPHSPLYGTESLAPYYLIPFLKEKYSCTDTELFNHFINCCKGA